MKVTLLCVGKPKEHWVDGGISEYQKRLSSTLTLETVWVKDNGRLIEHCLGKRGVIALDERGKEYTSAQFVTFLREELEKNGARLTLVIGGAEGLPPEIRDHFPLVRLSSMTFPHQMARLFLVEQLYRATTFWKGTPYHK